MLPEKFKGKCCPYCKTEFKDGDDIVICSDCNMPHHKECWIENQGCTTFACQGTIQSIDGKTIEEPLSLNENDFEIEIEEIEPLYCSKCGTRNLTTDRFCKKCGRELSGYNTISVPLSTAAGMSASCNSAASGYTGFEQNQANTQRTYAASSVYGSSEWSDGLHSDSSSILIGKKSEYYVAKFRKMRMENTKVSWNWCAFLVTFYWCIYRKMYAWGAGLAAGFLVAGFLGDFGTILNWAIYILGGIFGNYLYMQEIEKKASKCSALTEPYKTMKMAKIGGVNPGAVVCVILGQIVLYLLILL